MNEQERRQEILKAEESIRQLAIEMAHASNAAAQAEAAREKLDAATESVYQAIKDLQVMMSSQRAIFREGSTDLDTAKRSLENAAKTLASSSEESKKEISLASKEAVNALLKASERADRIETHITGAVKELESVANVLESSPLQLSAALSGELSQADRKFEERHKATLHAIENNSNKLQRIPQLIEDNRKTLLESVDSRLSQVDKIAEDRYNTSLQVLEGDSNKLKEISQSIEDNCKKIAESISSELSRIDKEHDARHNASLQILESKSKMFMETLNRQSSQLVSFKHWGVIFAALGLLGIWINVILLLFRS